MTKAPFHMHNIFIYQSERQEVNDKLFYSLKECPALKQTYDINPFCVRRAPFSPLRVFYSDRDTNTKGK